MIADREGYRWGKETILSVDGRIGSVADGDVAETAANDLARQCPVPAMALVSETEAADVQIGVGNQRSVIFVGSRGLAEKVTGAGEITFAELTGHAELVEKARLPVQSERGEVVDDGVLHSVPIRPVNVRFNVPVRSRTERDAGGGHLGKIQMRFCVPRGGNGRLKGRGSVIIESRGAEILRAEGPHRMGLPQESRVEAEGQIISFKLELHG